ncbi:DUF5689 domain-containing protein [Niabella aquatica]
MKNISLNKWVVLLIPVVLIVSCNRAFDAPPVNDDPEVDVTLTIMQLKARYAAIGDFKRIEDDQVISGVVIADDRSGNFYKQIIIQDETGGIPVLLDGNNVYTQYPVGRRIFIKLKGMMLGDYGGTIQVGLDSSRSADGRYLNLEGVPQALFDQYIIKGSFNNTIIPQIVKPSDFTKKINDPLLSTLVQINNAEFRDADINKTYADPSKNMSAINFTVTTCEKQNIILRNSSYARFAALNVPDGNGVLTGVPSIFNGTMQIFIRDTGDVEFTRTRCSGQVPVPTFKTIAELKTYATGDSSIPEGITIKGIVVSDTKNEAAGNYRLQDATAGMQLRFSIAANPAAKIGDSLTVNVGGLILSLFSGGLQVNNVEAVVKSGTGMITPRTATIAQIKGNLRAWESTVVTIDNVTVNAGSSNSTGTNYIVTDATGSINTFIRNAAGIMMPARATGITGYVSAYQAPDEGAPLEAQLILRNQRDIAGGTGGAFSVVYDFSGVTSSSGTTDPTMVPTVDGLTLGSFNAVGISANSSAGGRFSFSGWPAGAVNGSDVFTGSIDPARYYEVTITPAAGKKVDLTKISFTLQRSGTGIRQASVRSGLDSYAANLPASVSPPNNNLSVVSTNIFQIDDGITTAQDGCTITLDAAHTNLEAAVSFRFYGFNAESGGGTFSIDNVKFEGVVK